MDPEWYLDGVKIENIESTCIEILGVHFDAKCQLHVERELRNAEELFIG